ncbi:MAG: hypothetical protein AAF530_01290 [Pseudomonadota bacterium]
MLGYAAVLAWISPLFSNGLSISLLPAYGLVGLSVAAGGIFLLLPALIRAGPDLGHGLRGPLLWILAVGLAMRLALLFSDPILETDFHRYLWDGAVLFGGMSPYELSPLEVLNGVAPPAYDGLRAAGANTLERVNHPHLTTIYPPVAQSAFALSHWLGPWDLVVWRALLLVAEGVTLFLLLSLLRHLGRSPLWISLYWLNPLIVKELVNGAHMDALLLPCLLASVLLLYRGRAYGALAALLLACGIKLWPVLLLPLVARQAAADWREGAWMLSLFGLGLALITLPMTWPLVAALQSGASAKGAGVVAFGVGWAMNDGFFQLAEAAWRGLLALIGTDQAGADQVLAGLLARVMIGMGLVALCLWINWERARDDAELAKRALICIAALFLLSPAQFPWYYSWMVPFLVLCPSFPLLLLTALLPLYGLRFPLEAVGQADLFDHGVVWLEYLPVWLLLGLAWWSSRDRALLAARLSGPLREGPT